MAESAVSCRTFLRIQPWIFLYGVEYFHRIFNHCPYRLKLLSITRLRGRQSFYVHGSATFFLVLVFVVTCQNQYLRLQQEVRSVKCRPTDFLRNVNRIETRSVICCDCRCSTSNLSCIYWWVSFSATRYWSNYFLGRYTHLEQWRCGTFLSLAIIEYYRIILPPPVNSKSSAVFRHIGFLSVGCDRKSVKC